jgi:hypothetical protein
MPRTETTDVWITPLDLSIAKGAMCLGVSSRLSTNSISRFESYRVSNTGARWIFDCDSLLWLLLLHLCDSLWHDEPDGADQTNVGGVARRTPGLTFHGGPPDGASFPPDREMRRTGRPNLSRNTKALQIITVAHRASTRACEVYVWSVR